MGTFRFLSKITQQCVGSVPQKGKIEVARTKHLYFRTNDEELAVFERLAAADKLPLGTYIRRELLLKAEQLGYLTHYERQRNASRTKEQDK
jgi:hypothetical protein